LRRRRLVPDALQIATDHVAGDLQSGLAGIVVDHHIAAEIVLSQDVDAVVIVTDAHVVGYRVVAEVAATSVVVADEIPAYRGRHDLHKIVDIEMVAAADVDVAADRRGAAENFHPSAAVGVEVTSNSVGSVDLKDARDGDVAQNGEVGPFKGGAVSDLDIPVTVTFPAVQKAPFGTMSVPLTVPLTTVVHSVSARAREALQKPAAMIVV
jgi:hypothetical protein